MNLTQQYGQNVKVRQTADPSGVGRRLHKACNVLKSSFLFEFSVRGKSSSEDDHLYVCSDQLKLCIIWLFTTDNRKEITRCITQYLLLLG